MEAVPRRAVRAEGYPALEEFLVAEVRAARQADPLRPIDLLVGSNLLGVHLRRLLARRLGAVAAVRTPTFLDIARRRADRWLASEGLRPLPPLGDELLIGHIVEGLPDGGYFEPVGATPGFRVALLASIRDLKDAGWAPADLRARLRASGLHGDSLRKLEAFARIFESYERGLRERRLYDRSDLLARACAQIEGPHGGDGDRDALLLVYGFYDMIELQWRFFEAEARRRETVVLVPAGAVPAFVYAAPLVARMERAGFTFAGAGAAEVRRVAAVEASDGSRDRDPAATRASGELARLLERLFDDPEDVGPPPAPAGEASPSGSRTAHGQIRLPFDALEPTTASLAATEPRESGPRAPGQLALFVAGGSSIVPASPEIAPVAVPMEEDLAALDGDVVSLSPEELARLPVAFLSAPSEEREGEEVAAQVLAWAASGIRFHEMALLARQREPHLTTLARALERAGVPCVLASGAPLSESPAAAAFAALLAIPPDDWRRGDVIAFLSLAELPLGLRELEDGGVASPSEWDLLSAQGGVVGGREDWRRAFTRGIGRAQRRIATLEEELAKRTGEGYLPLEDDEDDVEARLASARREVLLWRRLESTVHRIESALAPWTRARTWEEAAEALRAAVAELLAPSEARASIDATVESLGALDAVGPYGGAAAFARAAHRALTTGRVRRGRYERDGVLLADVVSARGLSFRAVAVVGMVEKRFPAQGREDPLLLDHERAALASGPGDASPLPLKAARQAEEKLLFRIAAGAARERLLLARARAMGVEERESLPSPFLRATRQAWDRAHRSGGAGGAVRERVVPLLPPLHVESPTALDGLAWAEGEAWRLSGAQRESAAAGALREVFPFLDLALAAERGRWRARAFGAHDGFLSADAARTAASRLLLDPLSASRIERYASCPMRSFFESVLGLRPVRDPAEVRSIDPRDRGTLYHLILAELFAALAREAGGPVALASLDPAPLHERLLETAERRFETLAAGTPVGYPLLWEVEKSRMRENLLLALDDAIEESRDSGYLPAAFEWTFGRGEGSARAVAVDLPESGTVRFQGRIDRIDVHRDGRRARVIDYKTRDAEYVGNERRIADGRALQLPLYMKAASQFRTAASEALEVESGGYVFLSGDKPRAIGHEEERNASLTAALDVLVASIRAGDFTADPRDTKACEFCDFQDPCGESRQRLFGRKRGEPSVAARLALRERS